MPSTTKGFGRSECSRCGELSFTLIPTGTELLCLYCTGDRKREQLELFDPDLDPDT